MYLRKINIYFIDILDDRDIQINDESSYFLIDIKFETIFTKNISISINTLEVEYNKVINKFSNHAIGKR